MKIASSNLAAPTWIARGREVIESCTTSLLILFPVRPRVLGSQIAALPEGVRPVARLRYRRAKLLMALGVGLVIVPAVFLMVFTPDPGVPSSSHVLPLELYFACFGSGVVAMAAATANLARLRRTLNQPNLPR